MKRRAFWDKGTFSVVSNLSPCPAIKIAVGIYFHLTCKNPHRCGVYKALQMIVIQDIDKYLEFFLLYDKKNREMRGFKSRHLHQKL